MLGTSRAVAALVTSLLVAQPALAQSLAKKREAQELTKQAIAKSQANDHDAAVELYLKAYGIVPAPGLLSNIGTEFKAGGKPVEALKYFCMYLEKEPTGNLAAYVTAEAKGLYVELSGGQQINDADVCKVPVPPPKPAEPPPPAPIVPAPLPPSHPPEKDPGKTFKIAGIATGAAGVIAVGLGLYFGKEAARLDDLITNHPIDTRWPNSIPELENEGARDEKLQIAFLITGSALVIGGTVLYIVGRGKTANYEHAEPSISLAPSASADRVGLSFIGSF